MGTHLATASTGVVELSGGVEEEVVPMVVLGMVLGVVLGDGLHGSEVLVPLLATQVASNTKALSLHKVPAGTVFV
jgi:hypothetical protein